MVLSLISGLMLGVALLHLIPHSFAAAGAIDTVMIWTLAGLVFMLLLIRWFHFHQHDFGSAAADCELSSADAHHHAHAHDHAHLPEQKMGAVGLLAGLCVHTIVDGAALGAVLVSAMGGASLAGAGVFGCPLYRDRNGCHRVVFCCPLVCGHLLCAAVPSDRSAILFWCHAVFPL
jgi:zinc and cadmium transporter